MSQSPFKDSQGGFSLAECGDLSLAGLLLGQEKTFLLPLWSNVLFYFYFFNYIF